MSEQRLKSTISTMERRDVKSRLYALVPIDRGFGELNTLYSCQFARSLACSRNVEGSSPSKLALWIDCTLM
jgi:hypothetical protein